jgi:lipopolysaccharide/colanic/teichoic acid biosynthesis glycosyltransferase
MDIALALLGLVVAAPLMVVIAGLVRLDSPGNAIFSQQRLGLGGRVFLMHKFRKFPSDWGDRGAAVTVAADARMTRLGRFLERTKLDELPQLWNILVGEMSFVGPRPETLRFADLFTGEFARVHDFVPGIFGPNQVAFRNESLLYPPDEDPEHFYRRKLFPEKARNDLDYFRRATLGSDLWWIGKGLWQSLVGVINWEGVARRFVRIIPADLLLVEIAWVAANLLRFDGPPAGPNVTVFWVGAWLMPVVVVAMMLLGGAYRGILRHFGAPDALRLTMSAGFGWVFAYLLLLWFWERNASLGVGFIATTLSIALLVFMRVLHRERYRKLEKRLGTAHNSDVRGDNWATQNPVVVIYGAGERGAALTGLLERGFPNVRIAGFLDDDHELIGRRISEHPVLGCERDLDTIHAVHKLQQLWFVFEPDRFKYRRLREWCNRNAVRCVVLPLTEPFWSLSGDPRAESSTMEPHGERESEAPRGGPAVVEGQNVW